MNRFSSYKFTNQFSPFSFSAYSRLKFGCDSAAKSFAEKLATDFFSQHGDDLVLKKCVVIPSPYNYVENAATVLTKHFVKRLNHLLVHRNGEPVEYSTINRKVSYVQDYGFLKANDRKRLIDNDMFYLNKEFYGDKTLIFVDDVRITGTHEDKLRELLDIDEIYNDSFYLYIAQYEGDSPEIESQINFDAVKSCGDYVKIAQSKDSHMIVRPIKYILGLKEGDLNIVIGNLPPHHISNLYYGIIGEGLHKIPQYQNNFGKIKEKFLTI